MNLTKKTHHNPCFWTAFWNFEYLTQQRKKNSTPERPREILINVLNLSINKILVDKTKNVFYKKHIGLADLTQKGVTEYTKRNHPDQLESIENYYENDKSELILDFENHFTLMEDSYKKHLFELILSESITIETKTYISFFIFFQLIRNPLSLENFIKKFKREKMEKFEFFIYLTEILKDPNRFGNLISAIFVPNWKIYIVSSNIFPLSDNPVLIRNNHLMVAVAPNIMIEIDMTEKTKEINEPKITRKISKSKYREFINRTIRNSSKEIIFGDFELLNEIKNSRRYKNHLKEIKNIC